MTRPLSEIWPGFRAEFESRNQRLVAEFESAWSEMQALLETLKPHWEEIILWSRPAGQIASLEALFGEAGREVLAEPVAAFFKARIQERVLEAVADYREGIGDLVRQLPTSIEVSGRELAEAVGAEDGGAWRRMWLRWQGRPQPFPLRAVVDRHLERQAVERADVEGSLVLLLAQSSLELKTPWQALRREALRRLWGLAGDSRPARRSGQLWQRRLAKNAGRAKLLLERLRAWRDAAPAELVSDLLRGGEDSGEEEAARRPGYFSYWSRQRRAVTAVLKLDLGLVEAARQCSAEAQRSLDSLQAEHQGLLDELKEVIHWLQEWQREHGDEPFPPPQAQLVSAEERAAEWGRAVSAAVRSAVPETVETVNPKQALPPRRSPWRQIDPQEQLLKALEGATRRAILEGLREAEAAHRAVVREIERARQVVEFGRETAEKEGEAGLQVAREAVGNALSLVVYQKQAVGDVRPVVEKGFVQGLAAAFAQCHVAIEQGELGLMAHLAQQGGRQAAAMSGRLAVAGIRIFFQRARHVLARGYRQFLWRIGWESPVVSHRQHVVRRSYVGGVLSVDLRARDLPMIYQRLFRLQPLEDPRFLVGRDAEMAALLELRQIWEAGRPAAAILVGERGSGKTSLLNCAAPRVFPDVDIVWGQFQERIRTAEEMREFLGTLLDIRDGVEPAAALAGRRKVVMVEELERSFLRQVNGYQGLRELLGLIARTSHHILWILAVNQVCFRFLDAAVNLGQFFSHRINAMAVEPEDLQNAILLRHNLSGLRLHFAVPPEVERNSTGFRRLVGLEPDPQQLFFDALYRESEGIFRAAFELWQGQIERAEGGILYMRHPARPDYEGLVAGLKADDLFTLKALMQHGSLTAEELAAVFDLPVEESRTRLETLHDRELIHQDPGRPGFRVWPEAGHLVRTALHRQNLL